MRRVAIIFCAALWLAIPTVSRAQYNDTDQQNPKQYTDEDSQPLALLADVLYPVGYGLEWLVARPLHWVANDSPIAPAYRPVGGGDHSPPPVVPIIPDNTMDQASTIDQHSAGLVSHAGAANDECYGDKACASDGNGTADGDGAALSHRRRAVSRHFSEFCFSRSRREIMTVDANLRSNQGYLRP